MLISPLPALARGERPLRRYTDDGGLLVATNRALHMRITDHEWRRIAWVDIAFCGWSRTERAIVLRLWPTRERGAEIRIAGNSAAVAFIRDRVAMTRVLVRDVRLAGVAGTIVALRDPDGEGAVRWQLLVNGQDSGADDALRQVGEQVIAELRALAGC
jgi:hypothetical protein